MKAIHLVLSLGLLAAGMAACGGGDPAQMPAPAPLTQVPASAAASPEAYTEFARTQSADDTAEPLSLDLVATAPTSESSEPVALN